VTRLARERSNRAPERPMKPVDILTAVDIDRPVEVVARYAADPDHAPDWYDNIDSVDWRSERPLRVGTVVAFVARFLGRRLAYDYELVDYEPGVRLVMQTQQGPFPMETTYTWEPSGVGTHMTLRNRGTPTGFSAVAALVMVPAMRRANRKDLAKLKAILEAEPAPEQQG
jgi:uncharacterized membrane protein